MIAYHRHTIEARRITTSTSMILTAAHHHDIGNPAHPEAPPQPEPPTTRTALTGTPWAHRHRIDPNRTETGGPIT